MPPHVATFVLYLLRGAELQADAAACVFFADAGPYHAGNSFFDVEAQFAVDPALLAGLPAGARVLWQVDVTLPGGERVSSQTFTTRVQ